MILAIGDLGDRRVLAVLIRSLLVTLALFVGVGALLVWLLRGADPCDALGLGACPLGGATGGIGALVLTALALWLLFPAVAIGVVSAYGDEVVAAVEARHYPAAADTARRLGWSGSALLGLRGTVRVLVYNLLALPFYLVLLVTGIGPAVLLVVVNGLALGRDLGLLVAARHGDRAGRDRWLRATRGERALIGAGTTALFLVPFANLVAPVLGAAAATHLYHRGRRA
jgi:uncharacterized protein involved in cysteine biosynthesis